MELFQNLFHQYSFDPFDPRALCTVGAGDAGWRGDSANNFHKL
jgi:hypothetical protein